MKTDVGYENRMENNVERREHWRGTEGAGF
jgi:hypothetical protein